MRWTYLLMTTVVLLSAEPVDQVAPINVELQIMGYRIDGPMALVLFRATNREPSEITYRSHDVHRAYIDMSWQVDDGTWISQRYGVCGVGIRTFGIAAGASRDFTWEVGRQIRDDVIGVLAWKWVPATWPIRIQMNFCRTGTNDRWKACSELSGIDATLRTVMCQGIAVAPSGHQRPSDSNTAVSAPVEQREDPKSMKGTTAAASAIRAHDRTPRPCTMPGTAAPR